MFEALETIARSDLPTDVKGNCLAMNATTFPEYYLGLRAIESTRALSPTAYRTLLDTVAVDKVIRHLGASDAHDAPRLLAPADSAAAGVGSMIALRWQPVPGAATYVAEVEAFMPAQSDFLPSLDAMGDSVVTSGTEFHFERSIRNTIRWRVRAVDARGRPGPPSPWRVVR
ncbi:MAG TPA: hypothetical protein VFK13_12090 [Gemmatimonadaceae bacterium]|nr:hypothetical protein [Gemmatimonadaceae bacterium]